MRKLEWTLKDLKAIPKINKTVFSTFACGGGSTMGYKLSGYTVLGCLEIDKKMFDMYRANHSPLLAFNEGIQTFKLREDLPEQLYNLDILDGSPPCSSFSTVGARERLWQKKKKFREGQAEQVLDDLFFHWIDLVDKLKPKIAVAENVKGLITGNAKGYVKQIFNQLNKAGYNSQLFLLNSCNMGVPQSRPRVFFVCHKKDIELPKLKLDYKESIIPFSTIDEGDKKDKRYYLPPSKSRHWHKLAPGFSPNGFMFKIHPNKPISTQATQPRNMHWKYPRILTETEVIKGQTFPLDYDFLDNHPIYVCGMSVPPFMMNRLSKSIYDQWLSTI